MRLVRLIAIVGFGCLTGCETAFSPEPIPGSMRPVRPVADARKTLTVHRQMGFYEAYPPGRGIVFPPAVYVLEAEDDAYWYLRSPVPIELLTLERGEVVGRRRVEGGLMLAKRFQPVPAAGYANETAWGLASAKTMMWELGNEFRTMERKYWTKNF